MAQIYEIKIKTRATKQWEKPVTEYATILPKLWQEFDNYCVFDMKCTHDATEIEIYIYIENPWWPKGLYIQQLVSNL